jgi:hypothetical protein
MSGDTLIGPFGVIVPSNFAEPPLTGFAEDALPIFVPAEQCEGVDTGPIVTAAPPGRQAPILPPSPCYPFPPMP